jgi:hypothetical protein
MITGVLSLLAAVSSYMSLDLPHPTPPSRTQEVNAYFEKIRNDQGMLTAFFTAMPKGGDLHHHFSGSIYGETYWSILTTSNGWMNPVTIEADTAGTRHKSPWVNFETLRTRKDFDSLKQAFLRKSSVKDYNESVGPSDQHFFGTFAKFSAIASYDIPKGMQEFKQRALAENVSYIETMLGAPDAHIKLSAGPVWEKSMTAASLADSAAVSDTLDKVYNALITAGITNTAVNFCHNQDMLHQKAGVDDAVFMLRYQLHANRNASPLNVYRKLLIAFHAASIDPLIVGVNLVSPEDGEISMRDYTLHMLMVAHLHKHYPQVRYSLHAGELAAGMVRPELLRYHIRQAVMVAGAQRIGHGVDIAHEAQAIQLLEEMNQRKVAVEINLVSNEFILHVKNDQHPVMFYYTHKVPVVISTDDAAVLRTDLTQQYILLASRYPSLKYDDIKGIVRNSIVYSFLQPALKEQKLKQLDKAFEEFENDITNQKFAYL